MGARERISIIGPGRVGQTLGRALAECGYPIVDVMGRDRQRVQVAVDFIGCGQPRTDWQQLSTQWHVLLLTVSDDALADVARRAANQFGELAGRYAFHTSGFHSSTILQPLKARGAHIGSIHPLMTFAEPGRALEQVPGIYYALEGDESALALARGLIEELQGRWFPLAPEQKPLYHAAAVLACGHLVALIEAAFTVLRHIGLEPEVTQAAFGQLMQESLRGALQVGGHSALTGPFARGDLRVIAAHLEALAQSSAGPMVIDIYKSLGRQALRLAQLDETVRASIEELLR